MRLNCTLFSCIATASFCCLIIFSWLMGEGFSFFLFLLVGGNTEQKLRGTDCDIVLEDGRLGFALFPMLSY